MVDVRKLKIGFGLVAWSGFLLGGALSAVPARAYQYDYSIMPTFTKERAYANNQDAIIIDVYIMTETCKLPSPDGTYMTTPSGADCPGGSAGGWTETPLVRSFSVGTDNPGATFSSNWYTTAANGHVQVLVRSTKPGPADFKIYLDQAHTQWYSDIGSNDTYFDLYPTPVPCPATGPCNPVYTYPQYTGPWPGGNTDSGITTAPVRTVKANGRVLGASIASLTPSVSHSPLPGKSTVKQTALASPSVQPSPSNRTLARTAGSTSVLVAAAKSGTVPVVFALVVLGALGFAGRILWRKKHT